MSRELEAIWNNLGEISPDYQESKEVKEALGKLNTKLRELTSDANAEQIYGIATEACAEAEKKGFYQGFALAKKLLLEQ